MKITYIHTADKKYIRGIYIEPSDSIETIAAYTHYRVDELVSEIEKLLLLKAKEEGEVHGFE